MTKRNFEREIKREAGKIRIHTVTNEVLTEKEFDKVLQTTQNNLQNARFKLEIMKQEFNELKPKEDKKSKEFNKNLENAEMLGRKEILREELKKLEEQVKDLEKDSILFSKFKVKYTG